MLVGPLTLFFLIKKKVKNVTWINHNSSCYNSEKNALLIIKPASFKPIV